MKKLITKETPKHLVLLLLLTCKVCSLLYAQHIGQRPVFACGNEGGEGDIAMLKYSQSSKYPSFQLLIDHNDPAREYEYSEKTNASLNAAIKNNWHVVSIKEDWKEVFAKNKACIALYEWTYPDR